MTVAELITMLSTLDPNLEVMGRAVTVGWNHDFPVEFVRVDIIGGPTKADERMGVILT